MRRQRESEWTGPSKRQHGPPPPAIPIDEVPEEKQVFRPAQCTPLLLPLVEKVVIKDLAKLVVDYAAPEALKDCPGFPITIHVDAKGNAPIRPRSDDVTIAIEREGGICGRETCDCVPDFLWIQVKDQLGDAGRTMLQKSPGWMGGFEFWNSRWAGYLRRGWEAPDDALTMASRFQRLCIPHALISDLVVALDPHELRSPASFEGQLNLGFRQIVGDAYRIALVGDHTNRHPIANYLRQDTIGFHPLDQPPDRQQWGVQKFFVNTPAEAVAIQWKTEGKVDSVWDLRKQDSTHDLVDYAFPSSQDGVNVAYIDKDLRSIVRRVLLQDPETLKLLGEITEAKMRIRKCKVLLNKPECPRDYPGCKGPPCWH